MPGFFDLSDPQSALPLLGLLQGLGNAGMPSRTPVPFGSVIGQAAQGYMGGQQAAQQQALAALEMKIKQGALDDQDSYRQRAASFFGPAARSAPIAAAISAETPARPTMAGSQSAAPAATATQIGGAPWGSNRVPLPTPKPMSEAEAQAFARTVDPKAVFTSGGRTPEDIARITAGGQNPAAYSMHNVGEGGDKNNGMAFDATSTMPDFIPKLRAAGFPVTQAYNPAQTVQQGDRPHFHIGWAPHLGQTAALDGAPSEAAPAPVAPTQVASNGPIAAPAASDLSDPRAMFEALPPVYQTIIRSQPTPKDQIEMFQNILMKRASIPVPMTASEQADFVAKNPSANPLSTWGRDPATGNPVEILKSDTHSPAAQAQALEAARAEAVARYGAPLDSLQASNPNYIEDTARSIATYQAAAPTNIAGRVNPINAAVMERVRAINPDFDQKFYDLNKKVLANYSDKAKQGGQITALNASIQHIDLLEKVADALNRNDPKALNSLKNEWATQFGTTPLPNNLKLLSQFVSTEVTKAISGAAGGTREDRADLAARMSADLSKGLVREAATTMKGLLGGQLSALQQNFVAGMYGMPEDKARDLFKRYVAPETMAALGGTISGGGSGHAWPVPAAKDIGTLKMSPTNANRAFFDQVYGPGTAKRTLGK